MLLSWNVTRRCNLLCQHCYRDSGPYVETKNELSTAEGKKLLNEIKLAGFRMVIFSGGEALMRHDLFELTSYAAQIGLRAVLGTNGTLISHTVAEDLVRFGVDGVAISLDSVRSECHDSFRNQPGAWEGAIHGIKYSLAAGLRVQVNMTITQQNYDEFEAMADLLLKLGVQAFHPFFLVPTGRAINIEEDTLKKVHYFRMIKKVIEKQKNTHIELKPTCAPQFMPLAKEMGVEQRYTRGCLAGISYCCILPNGDVHICPYLPVKVGSVRETPYNVLWKNNEIFNRLRNFANYEGRCGACSDIGICGGCRARAYYYSNGNYLAEEPWCGKREVTQSG